MVIELLSYDSAVNLEPRTLLYIYNEISTVIGINGPEYCLNASPWIPFGLGFPESDYAFTEVNIDNLVSKGKPSQKSQAGYPPVVSWTRTTTHFQTTY